VGGMSDRDQQPGPPMTASRSAAVVILLLATSPALAQHQHFQPTATSYAGFEKREIKALSEQQAADLKAGQGMSLALAAELNGYPGPVHVLELTDSLGLSSQQRTRIQELYEAMRAETIPLGERLIDQEAELDRLFAGRQVTPSNLAAATDTIGQTQGTLRAAHLKYHLTTAALLTAEQIRRYNELRGYGSPCVQGPAGHAH
jgi:Spy/CpxP family protein refolding chaperone